METGWLKKIFKGDATIWCIFIALCMVSMLTIFSATSTIVYKQQSYLAPIIKHTFFLGVGLFVIALIHKVQTRFYSVLIFALPLAWILLVITMFMGEDVNGAQRWLGIGSITIQPSEIAKIAMIGFLAFFLSKSRSENENVIFKILIIGIGITCALIAPENLSTALLLFGVCFLMMFIGQISPKRLGKIMLFCAVVLIVGFSFLKFMPETIVQDSFPDRFATWQARIERHGGAPEVGEDGSVLDYKITDENYQVSHAKIAIANGGILGFPGSGVERDFLPQAYSDFVFAIILEEMGLLGGLFVLMLYVALMIRAGVLASKCDKLFPKYLILGSALILTVQALANMAVAVNMIPVTGQPLPLISRGGTSTIITCAYFGIILACSNSIKEEQHEDVDESLANVDYE